MRVVAMVFLACACSTPAPVVPQPTEITASSEVPETPTALCEFGGTWQTALYSSTGLNYGELRRGHGEAALHRQDDELLLEGKASGHGWELRSYVRPASTAAVHLAAPTSFGEVIRAPMGTRVLLTEENGQLRASLPARDMLRLPLRFNEAPPAVPVHCHDLALSARVEREASQSGQVVHVRTGATFAASPGGPVLATFSAETSLTQLRTEGEFALVHTRAGYADITGWVESSAIVEPEPTTGRMIGVLSSGALADLFSQPLSRQVCRAPVDLPLTLRHEDEPREETGVVRAGTEFVVLGAEGNALRIRPESRLLSLADGVDFGVRLTTDIQCETRQNGVTEVLSSSRRALPPAQLLRFTATVQQVHGLRRVRQGSSCQIEVHHQRSCRAVITCEGETLFGWTDRNGFFRCDFSADPARVVGEDAHTAEQGGDPAMRFDTDAGTLTMRDIVTGHLGEFSLEATLRPAP
ncbi:MAG: hypothetical protein AAGE52_18520 [Myxococcota bacterium]